MKPEELAAAAKKRLSTVRAKLLWKSPFWATCALHLKLAEMPEDLQKYLIAHGMEPTMATDGNSLVYCSEFVLERTDDELEFIIAHEIMHCLMGHQTRRGGRYPLLWNYAADLAINPILVDASVGKTPTHIALDARYKGMATEEIYAKVYEEAQKQGKSPNGSGNESGEGEDGSESGGGDNDESDENDDKKKKKGKGKKPKTNNDKMSKSVSSSGVIVDRSQNSSTDEQTSKWKEIAIDAANRAKQAGNLPAELEALVKDWIQPKVAWEEILGWWFAQRFRGEYTWAKRNRRVRDVYLPGRDNTIMGRLVIAFDTSGSMWYETDIFRRVLGAIQELLHLYKCEADIIDIDTRVAHHTRITMGDNLDSYTPKGGGGTCFEPAFQWVEDNLEQEPDGLIYFTDLEGSFPSKKPRYNVLWVVWEENKGQNVPFGTILHLPKK